MFHYGCDYKKEKEKNSKTLSDDNSGDETKFNMQVENEERKTQKKKCVVQHRMPTSMENKLLSEKFRV